jgi:DNA-directed RNA polymerase sigma subunit (sigma70/sigma32)
MTDRQLCLKVRKGDREAAETVQQRHAGLISRVLTQHYPQLRGAVYQDAYQAGRIGLHLAAIKFDHRRGKFAGLACRKIQNEIWRVVVRTALSDSRCGMHGRGVHSTNPQPSRQSSVTMPSGEIGEPIDMIPDKCSSQESLIDRLSPLARVVCRLLAAGRDPVQSLGLYEGELDRIRERAFAEVG